jgi:hypothetical protein
MLIALLIAAPACWAAIFGRDLAVGFDSIAALPETALILVFGAALLTVASVMRVRAVR